MGDTARHTEDGLVKVYPSCRPHGTTSYFAGAGDDNILGVGNGARLLFKLSAADISKSVDIYFNEDVYVKDGYMITRGAPFGAYVDVHIVHPTSGIVCTFGAKVPVLGDGWFPLDTEDRALLPAGMIMRITVHNSNSSDTIQDPAADFVLAGRIELFRTNTT